jgi:cephalosporin hydroxylase
MPHRRLRRILRARWHRFITDQFHRLWYNSRGWKDTRWFGFNVKQFPGDMWLYQEVVARTRPAYILQTGIFDGGSLLFFAHLLDLAGAAPGAVVIGIDVTLRPDARRLDHPRIRMIEGSSTDPAVVARAEQLMPDPGRGLVSLDSDHTRDHVLAELRAYHRFVPVGGYLVVEDTNINGHPVYPSYGPGPYEAVEVFLKEAPGFVCDNDLWRPNLFSCHHRGWLKRVG